MSSGEFSGELFFREKMGLEFGGEGWRMRG